jgi:hypothetical protein
MPNWCNNTVEIYHEDPAMIERVRKAFNGDGLLQEFIPCPAELHEHEAPSRDAERTQRFMEQYGASDWYNWQVQNWGTKWDVNADGQPAQDIEGGLILSFDSAWAPPVTAYERLMEQGFRVYATYYEPGMCFCGIWDNGDDNYFEYSDMSAAEVAETLPPELDEAYGISESMAEYEAENAEEDQE